MINLLNFKNVNLIKAILIVLAVVMSSFTIACGNHSFHSTVTVADTGSKKTGEIKKNYKIESVENPKGVVNELKKVIYHTGGLCEPGQVMKGTVWGEQIGIPVEWSCSKVRNMNTCFRINGLIFLDSLFLKYEETRDAKIGRRIMEYLVDWARQNPEYEEVGKKTWPWNDDTTANRVFRMSFYYAAFGGKFCSAEERKLLEQSLLKQVDWLMCDKFYTKRHNHGMHQDIALLAYSLLIEKNKERKKEILQKALSRTGEYIDYVFTDDGIHKEHSPGYAKGTLQEAAMMISLTDKISPEFCHDVSHKIQNSYEYLNYILKPDNTWPSIGDSSPGTPGQLKKDENMVLRDAAVYPLGGYSIFRSSWTKDATWIMFLASTHSSAHKHGDDLSFLVYHKGDLFVEGGKRNYNYKDRMTAWAYSGFAHNVLIVNDAAFPVKLANSGHQLIYPRALKTGIVDYSIDGDIKKVSGRQIRFENVEQKRSLCWDKKKNSLLVTDELDVKEKLNAAFLYHIAEGVVVKELKDGWAFYRDRNLVAEMHVENREPVKLETVTGREGRYPYCTWIFNGNDQPKHGSLLLIKMKCNPGKYLIRQKIELK